MHSIWLPPPSLSTPLLPWVLETLPIRPTVCRSRVSVGMICLRLSIRATMTIPLLDSFPLVGMGETSSEERKMRVKATLSDSILLPALPNL